MPQVRIKDNIVEIYPDDIYVMELQKSEMGVNKLTNNEFLIWECEIIEPEEHRGKIYKHLTPLEIGPKSKGFKFLLALGVPSPNEGEILDFNSDELNGREFVAQVTTVKITKGANTGKDRNDFKDVWSPEEFLSLQKKTAARVNVVSSIAAANSSTETSQSKAGSSYPSITKTIQPPKRVSILENSKGLTDFPE